MSAQNQSLRKNRCHYNRATILRAMVCAAFLSSHHAIAEVSYQNTHIMESSIRSGAQPTVFATINGRSVGTVQRTRQGNISVQIEIQNTNSRQGFERRIEARPNVDRAHVTGAIWGVESPYGISYSSIEMNRGRQAQLERFVREIHRHRAQGVSIFATVETEVDRKTRELKHAMYRIEAGNGARRQILFEVEISAQRGQSVDRAIASGSLSRIKRVVKPTFFSSRAVSDLKLTLESRATANENSAKNTRSSGVETAKRLQKSLMEKKSNRRGKKRPVRKRKN